MSLWIKICGNTTFEDALVAVAAGADAVGFVFAPSPRRVTAKQAAAIVPHLPTSVEKIGVFVDAALDEIVATVQNCGLTGVQLHFEAEPELPAKLRERLGPELRILRVVHFGADAAEEIADQIAQHARNPHGYAVLVDSRTVSVVGGSGVTFDWVEARRTVFGETGSRGRAESGECCRSHCYASALGCGCGLRRGSSAGAQRPGQGAGVCGCRANCPWMRETFA
jgi:phosphoribosylanthranilate isomerase